MKKSIKKMIAITASLVLSITVLAGNGITAEAAPPIHSLWDLEEDDVLAGGDIIECTTNVNPKTSAVHDVIVLEYTDPAGLFVFYSERTSVFTADGTRETLPASSSWIVKDIQSIGGGMFYICIEPDDSNEQDEVKPVKAVSSGCGHSCQWVTEAEATETEDGVMAYVCTKCGMVTDYMSGGTGSTSAYAVFNQNTIAQVNKALAGKTLSIDTPLWTSFSQKVMEAIAARRDINIILTYRLSGTTWEICIPAGAEVPTDVEYAGFDGYLAGLFGKNKL